MPPRLSLQEALESSQPFVVTAKTDVQAPTDVPGSTCSCAAIREEDVSLYGVVCIRAKGMSSSHTWSAHLQRERRPIAINTEPRTEVSQWGFSIREARLPTLRNAPTIHDLARLTQQRLQCENCRPCFKGSELSWTVRTVVCPFFRPLAAVILGSYTLHQTLCLVPCASRG